MSGYMRGHRGGQYLGVGLERDGVGGRGEQGVVCIEDLAGEDRVPFPGQTTYRERTGGERGREKEKSG